MHQCLITYIILSPEAVHLGDLLRKYSVRPFLQSMLHTWPSEGGLMVDILYKTNEGVSCPRTPFHHIEHLLQVELVLINAHYLSL